MYFYNQIQESKRLVKRIFICLFIIVILTIFLILNILYLQIIKFKKYEKLSSINSRKLIFIPPKRGIIYDTNGIPIAVNKNSYYLEVLPQKIQNLEETINTLRNFLKITEKELEILKKNIKKNKNLDSILIKKNLTEIQIAKIFVNQHRLHEIRIKKMQKRYYPYGSFLSHVLGYVSKVEKQDLENYFKKNYSISKNYFSNAKIGKSGIERYYEKYLHGIPGYQELEINNKGKVIRIRREKEPENGSNIFLTIDLNLQMYISKLLEGSRSAVVVTDPRDGSIKALVSSPGYDPNLFVKGISKIEYEKLTNDRNLPLINRATQGIYPPASTVKPYVSVSALSLGIIDKKYSMFDPGWWKIPGSKKCYRDWKKIGHGKIDIIKALEESADTFFYQIAYSMGIENLSNYMKKFGYGQYTGIDLKEEKSGIMPNKFWKMKKFKKPWYIGDTIPIGIGQGYWVATPLQMIKSLMILINNGKVQTPHFLKHVQKNSLIMPYVSKNILQIDNPKSENWIIAKKGMFGVANKKNGTAHKNFFDAPYKIAAKTGTAQVYSIKYKEKYNEKNISEKLRDHKLMVAFAPFHNPTVAVVVVLENGIGKNSVGFITRKILDYVLIKK
ncbi:penicillin-binding protein 2 [bacterium endosymbiont of Pedicinus badii]|nr:penicillin-binding protein 2 [bacterium endosymbiont of Pedicinus badii]